MAAIELAAVYVPIIPSLRGAAGTIQKELGLTNTTKVGESIGSSLGNHIGTGLKSVATGTVAVAAAGIGTALVRGFGRLTAIDDAVKKLTGLGHSAASVETIMGNALGAVRGTAFGLDSAATVAASAVAAGIRPGQDLERTLSLVADAATIAGTDMGSMGAIFNGVAASNKVQMDTINQLHDAGVPALVSLADHMGVTAEEAAAMASAGEIDFATFQAAMENTLGGAALSSGDTFSGAMANVGASIGRVGAGILGGVFPRLAPLFQTITSSLAPLEAGAAQLGTTIGEKVSPVIDWLVNALENGLGQFRIAPAVLAPLTAAFIALGSSGLAPIISMVPGLSGFASRLGMLGGPVGLVIAAFVGLIAVSPGLQTALGGLFEAIGGAGAALAPTLGTIAELISGALVTAINIAVPVISTIVTAISGLLTWLTDSEIKIAALTTVIGIAGGAWLTYKTVLAGVSFASMIAGLTGKTIAFGLSTAAKAKDLAATVALSAMYTKGFVVALASTVAGIAASSAAWVVNTASLVAARVATVAIQTALLLARGAMVVATAAQWLFNAALMANPIGLIIGLIAALVAGLVWFFTQTTIGQEIWTGFMNWLGEAWTNITNLGRMVWEGLGSFFTDLWSGIGSFFTNLWTNIISTVTNIWETFSTSLQAAINALSSWWNGIWSGIGSFFTNLWNSVVNVAQNNINNINNVIRNVVGGLSSWWNGIWSGIGSFFTNLWNNVSNTARNGVSNLIGAVQSIPGAIMRALSGAGTWLIGTGRNIITGMISGITSMVSGAINAVINVGRSIIDGAKNFLGIRSPSRLFRDEIGEMVGLGLAEGIENSQGAVDSAIDSLVTLPELSTDLGIITSRASSYEVASSGVNSGGFTVSGPLIEVAQMVVDNDSRVTEVAQELYERVQRASRANGRINLGGAVTV